MGSVNDYGLVSDGHGFEDSPDSEKISSGINSKGPYAVAIGRQANLLQWGFYASPERMTPSAQKVFLNAIVYMTQFDGDRPLVDRKAKGRSWYEQYIGMIRKMPAEELRTPSSRTKYLETLFPAQVIAESGLDPDALEAWRAANVEYFHSLERYKLGVDEDLKALGLSNRTPAFLVWLEEQLEKNPNDEIALRLARRYLGPEHGSHAGAALDYVRSNRDRLYFSDVGGYQWFVKPAEFTRNAP